MKRYMVPVEIVSRDVPGGILLLDFLTGDCFGLNLIGARAWLHVEQTESSIAEICELFSDDYGVPRAQLEHDMADLFKSLVQHRLLVLCP